MKQAIRTLGNRIDLLYREIDIAEKSMEEPEMNCEIEFAMNDIANFQREIKELQEAIEILNNHQFSTNEKSHHRNIN